MNQRASCMRCLSVRLWRRSRRRTALLRTPRPAIDAMSPIFTSSVTMCSCTGAHYNGVSSIPLSMAKIPSIQVTRVAEARFPTRFGEFRIFGFIGVADDGREEEGIAIRMGDGEPEPPPLGRVHP